jgi:hypothetical protein
MHSTHFVFLWSKGPNCFPTLGGQLFILFTKTARPPPTPRNQLVVPKTNQEINEPSYEMVGVKITVTIYGQIKSYFCHFFSCWFFIFFSDNSKCFHRNGFEMYILIIIYTVCTCDTLVPTRILNSEISWFCFDFPKWGHSLLPISMFLSSFSNKLIKSEWNSLQLIISR